MTVLKEYIITYTSVNVVCKFRFYLLSYTDCFTCVNI